MYDDKVIEENIKNYLHIISVSLILASIVWAFISPISLTHIFIVLIAIYLKSL